MMVFCRKDGYRRGVLLILDNKIAYIATVSQVRDVGGKHMRGKCRAVNHSYELVQKLRTGKNVPKREGNRGELFYELRSLKS